MKKLVLVAAIAATTFGAVSTAQAEVTTTANAKKTLRHSSIFRRVR